MGHTAANTGGKVIMYRVVCQENYEAVSVCSGAISGGERSSDSGDDETVEEEGIRHRDADNRNSLIY